jgi:hypothetical protein
MSAAQRPLPQRDSAAASGVAVTLELPAVIQSEWGEFSLRCPPERRFDCAHTLIATFLSATSGVSVKTAGSWCVLHHSGEHHA